MGKQQASGTRLDGLKSIIIGGGALAFGLAFMVPIGIAQDLAINRRRERRGEFHIPAVLERARNRDTI